MAIPTAKPLTPTAKCGLCNRDLYSWMTVGDCKNDPTPPHCPMRWYEWEAAAYQPLNQMPTLDYLKIGHPPLDYDRSREQQQEAFNNRTTPPWLVGPGLSLSSVIAFVALASVVGGFVFFYFWLFH